MSSLSAPPPAPPPLSVPASTAAPTVRVRLGELAATAALSVKGVSAMAPDPRGVHKTPAAGGELTGVGAAATAGGRYEVNLHLRAELVPLHPLAERVRESVQRAASRAYLAAALGPVSVFFEDLAHPLDDEPGAG